MRVRLRVPAIVGASYLAAYTALSLAGTYERQFPEEVWRAKWCWSQSPGAAGPARRTLLGGLFYPLVAADARVWHRTRPVIWDPL